MVRKSNDKLANVIVKFVKKMRSKQRGLTLREMTYFVGLGSSLPRRTIDEQTRLALWTGVRRGIYVYSNGFYKLADMDKPHVIKKHIVTSAGTPKASHKPGSKARRPRKQRKPRRNPRPPREPRNPVPIPMGRRLRYRHHP